MNDTQTIITLIELRNVVRAYQTANTAICSATIASRCAGQIPKTDICALVQAQVSIASRNFKDAYKLADLNLNGDDSARLHAAVWSAP